MTDKNTAAFFSKTGAWWWFLFIASCSLISAYPLRESREAVDLDLVEAVQQEVCNVRSSLPNLYKIFHEDYASASKNGTPAAGPFICECIRHCMLVHLVPALVACTTACYFG